MTAARLVPLAELQPSQLYVSRAKLAAVFAAWMDREPASLEPIPVKRYGGRVVATDGHTRALAAHPAGHVEILVVPDVDDLDDEAYEICVGWCLEANVRSVPDRARIARELT